MRRRMAEPTFHSPLMGDSHRLTTPPALASWDKAGSPVQLRSAFIDDVHRIVEARMAKSVEGDDRLARKAAWSDAGAGEWNSRDGRITDLRQHCTVDPAIGNEVQIALRTSPIKEPQLTEPMPEIPSGDSAAQRAAEMAVLALLKTELSVDYLAPEVVHLSDQTRVEIDAVNLDPPILVEIWAHQGSLRGGQPNKVMVDAMKLLYVEAVKGIPFRKIICFTDGAARKPFLGKSWRAAALAHYGIELMLIDLPADVRETVVQAQKDQFR